MTLKRIGLAALMVLVPAIVMAASFPQLLRMKGRFTDTQTPLTDTLPVHFSIWDTADGYGNLLWQDTQEVAVQNNNFQVVLGRGKALTPSVFSGGDRWVEIQIGSDSPMRPRHKIPSRDLQAQVAAVRAVAAPPPPPPAPAVPVLTEAEKRELELQLEQLKETPPAKPVKPVVKAKPVVSNGDGTLGPTYEVKAGDTLKSIAVKLYGNSELWYDLYYLNRDRLGPMGHLFPGQTLVLPNPNAGERKK